MNPEQLKEYKREKSRKFNANLRELRLKDKANQPLDEPKNNQKVLERDDERNPVIERIENKIDELNDNVERIDIAELNDKVEQLETKIDELMNTMSVIEAVIESKMEKKKGLGFY
jgi:DNA repair exonuclease SbcCD ATPase subunit